MGASAAFVVALLKRRLSWDATKNALWDTFKLMGMIGWIIACVTVFSNVYNALGAPKIINEMIAYFPAGGFGVIVFMQLSIFVLGTFMDDFALLFLTMPIFVPIVNQLGFDPIWFGVLILINMQCALLTPPLRLQSVLHAGHLPALHLHLHHLPGSPALYRPSTGGSDPGHGLPGNRHLAARGPDQKVTARSAF